MGGVTEPAIRVRQNAWTLSQSDPWHPTIYWYERAFDVLKKNEDVNDPRSLLAIANIHGTELDPNQWPPQIGVRGWNACQHASWYFLPWHRIYLHYYETILRDIIDKKLHGPSDWALPFWFYDPTTPATLALPPAFLAPLNRDGDENALYTSRRETSIMAGGRVNKDDVETSGWPNRFSSQSPFTPTFGGPQTGWSHRGSTVGSLEREPHGLVHGDVGGPFGLMSLFETAAQDPIFWLHHANIDRLWDVWRNGQGHQNPIDSAWLTRPFNFGFGADQLSMLVGQTVDTTAAPLDYRYEGVPVPTVPSVGGGLGLDGGPEEAVVEDIAPELVGASDGPVPLTGSRTSVRVDVTPPGGPLGLAPEEPPAHVFLTLQNVRGKDVGMRSYAVYIEAPSDVELDSMPHLLAGRFSTFGVMEASQSDEWEPGNGLTFSFDITSIVQGLQAVDAWDPATLNVTVVPQTEVGQGEPGVLEIGQIGVYYG